MSYNLYPSMRAIKLYEELTHTSFLELEDKQEYILHLIYCCLIAHPENEFYMTFDAACKNFFDKNVDTLVASFTSEMEFINQFQSLGKEVTDIDEETITEEEKSSPTKDKKLFLSSVIPILVYDCHLDIKYVLDEMPYTDVDMYINYSAAKKREEMEEKRFWTYLSMLPHVDSKKLKKAEDLVEFSWEKKKNKEKAEKEHNYNKYPKTNLSYYKIGRSIGHGAFGKVNLALHILSGRYRTKRRGKNNN